MLKNKEVANEKDGRIEITIPESIMRVIVLLISQRIFSVLNDEVMFINNK